MQATGIPNHLAIADELMKLSERIKEIEAENKKLREMLLQRLAPEVAAEVVKELRQHFDVTGMQPVSRHDVVQMINDMNLSFSSLEARLSSKIDEAVASREVSLTDTPN